MEAMFFPCALTLGTYGIAKRRTDRSMHFYSMNLDSFGVVEASLDDLTNKASYRPGRTIPSALYGPSPKRASHWTLVLTW